MGAYEIFADLLDYPRPAPRDWLQDKTAQIAGEYPQAAALLGEFRRSIVEFGPGQLEEIYAQTFDFRAEASLYVGHHLFGEHFRRSLLMSRLKAWYAATNYSSGAEMPDHLCVVLRFLALNSNDRDAGEFLTECLSPAVARMLAGLQDGAGPYKPVLDALLVVLQAQQALAADPGAD